MDTAMSDISEEANPAVTQPHTAAAGAFVSAFCYTAKRHTALLMAPPSALRRRHIPSLSTLTLFKHYHATPLLCYYQRAQLQVRSRLRRLHCPSRFAYHV